MHASPGLPRIIDGAELKPKIAELRRQAQQIGKLAVVEAALEALEHALLNRPLPRSDDPDTFGDPRFSIPPFTICVATVTPIVAYFGVTTQPIDYHGRQVYPVFIRELHLVT